MMRYWYLCCGDGTKGRRKAWECVECLRISHRKFQLRVFREDE